MQNMPTTAAAFIDQIVPPANEQTAPIFRFETEARVSEDFALGAVEAVFACGSLKDPGIAEPSASCLFALLDYRKEGNGPTVSVVYEAGRWVPGHVLFLTKLELARLDSEAERRGDYHRFKTAVVDVKGTTVWAWVYQLTAHADTLEQQASVCPDLFTAAAPKPLLRVA